MNTATAIAAMIYLALTLALLVTGVTMFVIGSG
jgi:hypothetical protein